MMTALEFLKAKVRMTQDCNIDCLDCPLSYRNNKTGKSCTKFIITSPEKAIEIVENWAKEQASITAADVESALIELGF